MEPPTNKQPINNSGRGTFGGIVKKVPLKKLKSTPNESGPRQCANTTQGLTATN